MNFIQILSQLKTWTPYLLDGFGWNILIALVSMLIGTVSGLIITWLGERRGRLVGGLHWFLTEFTRNVPTFVFQFYLAFMLPGEMRLPGFDTLITIPVWIKASLALSLAVAGFVATSLPDAIREWRKGHHIAALLFISSWTNYFLIIVMASSTASVIGVSELVSRCNTVVNATGDTSIMLWFYLYACVFFFGFCYPITVLMRTVRTRLGARIEAKASK